MYRSRTESNSSKSNSDDDYVVDTADEGDSEEECDDEVDDVNKMDIVDEKQDEVMCQSYSPSKASKPITINRLKRKFTGARPSPADVESNQHHDALVASILKKYRHIE